MIITGEDDNPMTTTLETLTDEYTADQGQWQAVNGTTQSQSFGSGPEGKRRAQLAALGQEAPEIYKKVIELAELHYYESSVYKALIKAGQVLSAGQVFIGQVQSQSDSNTLYAVTFDGCPSQYECDCPHQFQGYSPYSEVLAQRVCKHILAQHLAYLLDFSLTEPPIFFAGEPVMVYGLGTDNIEVDF